MTKITNQGGDNFRIESDVGYCLFSVNRRPSLSAPDGGFVTSFSGSIWPDAFPEVFEALPSSVQLGSCRFRVRDLSILPETSR